jgi:hypothetical protein
VAFEEVRESQRFAGYKELYSAPSPVKPEGQREFMLFGVAHLLHCLEQRHAPVSSGYDGRCALEVISALQESACDSGAIVHLPLTKSQVKIKSR